MEIPSVKQLISSTPGQVFFSPENPSDQQVKCVSSIQKTVSSRQKSVSSANKTFSSTLKKRQCVELMFFLC